MQKQLLYIEGIISGMNVSFKEYIRAYSNKQGVKQLAIKFKRIHPSHSIFLEISRIKNLSKGEVR